VTAPVTIRDAFAGDREFLVRCNCAMALETEALSLDPHVVSAGVAAALADSRHGFYLVAEQHDEPAGCLLVTTEWSDWRNGAWWWFQSVYVLPSARRQGVFRSLQAEVVRRARCTPGVIGLRLYVERDNRAAQAAYAELGLHETAYRMFERGLGDGDDDDA
jgi:GNAT superfamily N-acetyltransferase